MTWGPRLSSTRAVSLGMAADVQSPSEVLSRLFGEADEQGLVSVREYPTATCLASQAERTERYISYWLILGVFADYEVTGAEGNYVLSLAATPGG